MEKSEIDCSGARPNNDLSVEFEQPARRVALEGACQMRFQHSLVTKHSGDGGSEVSGMTRSGKILVL